MELYSRKNTDLVHEWPSKGCPIPSIPVKVEKDALGRPEEFLEAIFLCLLTLNGEESKGLFSDRSEGQRRSILFWENVPGTKLHLIWRLDMKRPERGTFRGTYFFVR